MRETSSRPACAVGDAAQRDEAAATSSDSPLALDHAQRQRAARRHAVVVLGAVDVAQRRAGRGIADATRERCPGARGRAPAHHCSVEPSDTDVRRHAEDLRRQVLVAAVDAGDAAHVVARAEVVAEQQAVGASRFSTPLRARQRGLEVEVVERPVVACSRACRAGRSPSRSRPARCCVLTPSDDAKLSLRRRGCRRRAAGCSTPGRGRRTRPP